MQGSEALITRFYTAFSKLDYAGMQDCYSEDAIFSDPVFGLLQGSELKAMWEMLCKAASEFALQFGHIQLLDEEYATCEWTASYRFSATGRPVVNQVKAYMRINGGRITEHSDKFDLWKWSRQAMGWKGWVLGWSTWFQVRVQKRARRNLEKFIREK